MYPKALLASLITFLLFLTTLSKPTLKARQDDGTITLAVDDASESQGASDTEAPMATNTTSADNETTTDNFVIYRPPSYATWYQIWFYKHRRSVWCNKQCCNFDLNTVNDVWAVGAPTAVLWQYYDCTGDYIILDCGPLTVSGQWYSMSQIWY